MWQELNLFQESLTSLKMAQTKFQNSGECLEKITSDLEGRSILVPLTGSVSFQKKTLLINVLDLVNVSCY